MRRVHPFTAKSHHLYGRRLTLASLLTLCALVVGSGIWVWKAAQTSQAAQKVTPVTNKLPGLIRAGLGGQVRFSAYGDSAKQVSASVDSVATFIYERSGLKMSDETRRSIVQVEQDTLKGKANRIGINQLTATLTDITTSRLKTITDKEIDAAAQVFANAKGEISTRSNRSSGVITRDEFVDQLKAGRDWSQTGDSAVKAALKPTVETEVRNRISNLTEALPDQFGQAQSSGVTLLQAVVISYSVVADDSLAFSRSDLAQQRINGRMFGRVTRADKKTQKDSGRPFGVNGYLYSSPAYLLFNKDAVGKLIDSARGGANK